MKKKMIALAGSLVVAAPENGGCGEEDCCREEMGPRFQPRAAGFLREVMDYLGIAPEDMRELRGERTGPRDILEELGLTQEEVEEAVEAVLEEKVADGTLTQEQADRILERIGDMKGWGMGRLAFGPGPLMRGTAGELPERGMGPGAVEHWREHAGEEATPGVWRPGKGAGHMNNCG